MRIYVMCFSHAFLLILCQNPTLAAPLRVTTIQYCATGGEGQKRDWIARHHQHSSPTSSRDSFWQQTISFGRHNTRGYDWYNTRHDRFDRFPTMCISCIYLVNTVMNLYNSKKFRVIHLYSLLIFWRTFRIQGYRCRTTWSGANSGEWGLLSEQWAQRRPAVW